MNRRDVIINSVKIIGLGLLAPTLAKASEQFSNFGTGMDFDVDADGDGERSETLVSTLEQATGKSYKDITPEDLAKVERVKLLHIHIDNFDNRDFVGLDNLKFLNINSIFHTKPGVIAKEVFLPLRNLETLELTFNQFSDKLSPDVFIYLTSLKTLDIASSTFRAFPESVFTALPRLESLIVSRNLAPQILERLTAQFGPRLVVK